MSMITRLAAAAVVALSFAVAPFAAQAETIGDGGKIRMMASPYGTQSFIPFVIKKYKLDEKYGFTSQPPTGAGHFVGMSVHDVGNPREPFRPGMVIAVEPIIEIPEKQLHIRIEDTVLVTDNEPLILSASVPKEVDEVLALIKGQS